jgi:hypothetical protein
MINGFIVESAALVIDNTKKYLLTVLKLLQIKPNKVTFIHRKCNDDMIITYIPDPCLCL